MLYRSYRYKICRESRQRCCRGACQIIERLKKTKHEYRGFETSRDLVKTSARLVNRRPGIKTKCNITAQAFFSANETWDCLLSHQKNSCIANKQSIDFPRIWQIGQDNKVTHCTPDSLVTQWNITVPITQVLAWSATEIIRCRDYPSAHTHTTAQLTAHVWPYFICTTSLKPNICAYVFQSCSAITTSGITCNE